jgi:hypothetical protein
MGCAFVTILIRWWLQAHKFYWCNVLRVKTSLLTITNLCERRESSQCVLYAQNVDFLNPKAVIINLYGTSSDLIYKQRFLFQVHWINDVPDSYYGPDTSVIQWTWKKNFCLYMRLEGVYFIVDPFVTEPYVYNLDSWI